MANPDPDEGLDAVPATQWGEPDPIETLADVINELGALGAMRDYVDEADLDHAIRLYVGMLMMQLDEPGAMPSQHAMLSEDLDEATVARLQAEFQAYARQGPNKALSAIFSADTPKGEVFQAADPVSLFNGEFTFSAVDLSIDGAGMDFIFRRSYRHQAGYQGPLGFKWDHSYNLWIRELPDGNVLRSTGDLSEQRYVRHKTHGYLLPPDGEHSILIDRAGFDAHRGGLLACCPGAASSGPFSFIARSASGVCHLYEPADAGYHRIARLQDPNGNYLSFRYDADGRLDRVEVNHPERTASFSYDASGHIASVTSHPVTLATGAAPARRSWRYEYDSYGDLVRVTGPAVPEHPGGIVASFEYNSAFVDAERAHAIVAIREHRGALWLGLEYGAERGTTAYNRVVRQFQGGGEFLFEYERLLDAGAEDARVSRVPTRKAVMYERNGHAAEHWFNEAGNLLNKREFVLSGGAVRSHIWTYRYNEDGACTGSLSPEGSLAQSYFGRDDFERFRRTTDDPSSDAALTAEERLGFGDILSRIRRGSRQTALDLMARVSLEDVFGDYFPDPLTRVDPADVIVNSAYDPVFHQEARRSDPAVTDSSDPRSGEAGDTGSGYAARSIVSEYGPTGSRTRVTHPAYSYPAPLSDGTIGAPASECRFETYDEKGRLLRWRDDDGLPHLRSYVRGGVRDGYPAAATDPYFVRHLDLRARPAEEVAIGAGWAAEDSALVSDGRADRIITIHFEGTGLLLRLASTGAAAAPGARVEVSVDGGDPVIWEQAQGRDHERFGLARGAHVVVIRTLRGASARVGLAAFFATVEWEPNEAGYVLASTDARGFEVTRAYDALGQVVEMRGPEGTGVLEKWRHDARGQETEHARAVQPAAFGGDRWEVTRFKRDIHGNLLESAVGGDVSPSLVTRHSYDSMGNRLVSVGPRGTEIVFRYDARGRTVKTIRGACGPQESVISAEYDGDGQVVRECGPRGEVTRSLYDALGRLAARIDPAGGVRRYVYDKRGNQCDEFVFAGAPLLLVQRTTNVYDERGRINRNVEYSFAEPIEPGPFDPLDLRRDPRTDLAGWDDAVRAGKVTELRRDYYLDPSGRAFLTTRYAVGPDGTASAVRRFEARYAPGGAAVWSCDPSGRVTALRLDEDLNVVRTDIHEPPPTAGDGSWAVFSSFSEWDALDRETAAWDGLGNRSEKTYDSLGRVIAVAAHSGASCRNAFDVYGRLRESTQAGPEESPLTTRHEYDPNGNLVRVTLPDGSVTECAYDELDRQVSVRQDAPSGPVTVFRYDAASNVVTQSRPDGTVLRRRFDALGRLERLDVDASGSAEPAASQGAYEEYDYDGLGRLVGARNAVADIEIRFDSLGRALTEKTTFADGLAYELRRGYDAFGNLTRLVYPGGRVIERSYDKADRLVRIDETERGDGYPGPAGRGSRLLAEFWFQGGRLMGGRSGNGIVETRNYDRGGRLIEIGWTKPDGSALRRLQQLRDGADQLRVEVDAREDRVFERRFAHDAFGRLTGWSDGEGVLRALGPFVPADRPVPAGGQTDLDKLCAAPDLGGPRIAYDAGGSRREATGMGADWRYASDGLDRYRSVTRDGAPVALRYGAAGNVEEFDGRRLRYTYKDQLAETTVGRAKTEYAYDAFGRLAWSKDASGVRRMLYDRQDVIEVRDGDGRCLTQYVNDRGIDRKMQVAAAGEEAWFHLGPGGTTLFFTDAEGAARHLRYGPFGECEAADVPDRHLFMGRPLSADGSFYDFRLRTYVPELGRFHQRDVELSLGAANAYAAFENDPLEFGDPSGASALPVQIGEVAQHAAAEIATLGPQKGLEYVRDVRQWMFDATHRLLRPRIGEFFIWTPISRLGVDDIKKLERLYGMGSLDPRTMSSAVETTARGFEKVTAVLQGFHKMVDQGAAASDRQAYGPLTPPRVTANTLAAGVVHMVVPQDGVQAAATLAGPVLKLANIARLKALSNLRELRSVRFIERETGLLVYRERALYVERVPGKLEKVARRPDAIVFGRRKPIRVEWSTENSFYNNVEKYAQLELEHKLFRDAKTNGWRVYVRMKKKTFIDITDSEMVFETYPHMGGQSVLQNPKVGQ